MPDALTTAFYDKGDVILARPLGRTIEMGSVGYFSDGTWLEVSTTKKMFGIELAVAPGAPEPNSFDGKRGKHLKFEGKADGETSTLVADPAKAKARIEISFGAEGSFIMNVKNQRVTTARDLGDLMIAIRHAYHFRNDLPEGERWEKRYAVVVGVASADSVTALLSTSASATAIVSGNASAKAPATPAQLDASMSVSFSEESVDDLWRGPAIGYAFQALKIEPSIFTRWNREKFEQTTPSRLGFAPAKVPPRSAWAHAAKFNPEAVKLARLGPSGSSKGTLTVRAFGAKAAGKPRKAAPRGAKKTKRTRPPRKR
jgi:hypothetical protein